MNTRKKLSGILHANACDKLAKAWANVKAAEDLVPLSKGEYIARIIDGALITARTGTLSYKLTFCVTKGEYAGRRFWHDIYLTEAALPMAKRDLGKPGVTRLDQLDHPLPPGIQCKVQLTLRRDDNGTEYNQVIHFAVVDIEMPQPDPFAPTDPGAVG